MDILLPLMGRKYLVRSPINTHHLLERFSLFTLILLGESVISILAVLQSSELDMAIHCYLHHYFSINHRDVVAIFRQCGKESEQSLRNRRANHHLRTFIHLFIVVHDCSIDSIVILGAIELFIYVRFYFYLRAAVLFLNIVGFP